MVLFIFRFLSLPTWIAMLVMPLLVAPATAQTTPSNTDTTLSALTFTPGTLLSTFASDKTTYAFAVQSGATEITVTATPTNSGASVTITPADASATSGHQVDVSSPPVSIRIVVSPAMGTTTLTYTVSAGNFTDYDTDGDNLIELGAGQTGLAQLHAMRWDLNGNGFIDASATTSDTTAYNTAFSNRPPGMGCETTCIGYELTANLNFDENSDNEITATDATYWNSGAGWAPIGSSATKYTGTFHGNDYTISNLFIDRSAASKTGLFGYAEGNTIRNLSLVDANVTGYAETAVLVGEGNNLQLMHIRVTGRVSGSARSAGLVGRLAHGNSTITACRSEVDVTGSNISIGGLVGWSSGTIIASYATGAVSGYFYVGGLVGFHGNTGNPKAVIRASYATGVVSGDTDTGGLVGANFYSSTITGSYAIGPVSANSRVGGLVGLNSNSSITHSYYDRTTTRRGDTGRGAPQTTAELQGPTGYTTGSIYANWNLNLDGQPGGDDPWTFGKTDQYPVLKYAGMDTTAQYNLQPPGIPTSVTVTQKADTLDVRWRAASYATGYKVQWKASDQNYAVSREETVTGTRYKIANLIGGTTYTVRVIATKTGTRDGMPSAEQTGVPVLLGSPTVMVAAKVDTLTVTWNVVNGATGYKVQWKSGSETYPAADEESATRGQATIAGGGTTIHKISGLTAGTTYTIRVIATNTSINVADSAPSEEVMVTLATTKPTNVRVTPGHLQLIVRWTEATGATGYKIQWRSGQQTYNTSDRQETVSGGSTTTYTIENLTFGTTYTVRVTATLAGGADSTPSDEVMGTPQGIDYDGDGDGLIDIETLAQLHAIRWDLNGDGVVADNDTMTYNAAFPNRDTTSNVRMGCPSGTCTGYELLNNLDFDENGDGEITSADATYWDNGAGWLPIGTAAARYTGDFKGNGYTIDNLTINRPAVVEVGLFGNADTASRIESVGVTNASVAGGEYAGALVGALRGEVVACYSTGNVSATTRTAGGLVGWTPNAITSSYSTASVSGPEHVGGLLGASQGGTVTNSYSIGTVIGTGSSPLVGGLIGSGTGGTASYWDTQTSGCTSGGSNGCTTSAGGGGVTGQTTSALQSPTDYTLIFSTWNANLDGQAGDDDPWTFGAADQYPVLKYAGMDTTVQYNLQPPGIPTSVTVTPKADTLDVRWTAASYATGYKVQWKSGDQSYAASRQGTVTGTRYKISNLISGTYTVRVIATKTGAPDGMPSAEQTSEPLLVSPTVMVAAKVDTLTVTWNAVDDATGYKVQWKSGSETYPAADEQSATRGQATIAGGGTTIHKISGLTTGTTYTIRVIATSTNSNVADSAPSEEVMGTLATTRPTNVRVTPGPVQLIVTWTEATGATGYKIQWKSGQQAYNTSSRQETVSGGSTTTYTIENLTFGTTYTVRVTATLSGGADSTPSDEVMGTPQGINYDSDGDGLIDIKTLAQLHAIRWDLNGDGVVADNDTMNYNAAFPGRDITSNGRMGCPSGTCTGYELLNNLDFDENGDDQITSADATYWDNGAGWLPIGTDAARYTGDFKGNGYTIDNLTINRPSVVEVGLFGNADTASRIESVGVTNASVAGGEYAGALVGALRGTVVACYSTGNVSATTRTAGGLVGWTPNAITSSYSTASVSGPEHVGGLLGASQGGTVTNSYSTGVVTRSSGTLTTIGGLIGSGTGGTASYWDTQTSGCTSGGSNGCTTSAGGGGVTGQTTSALQSPTGYTLIFSTWNANLDGQAGDDDPWTFGAADQYPVLKYAGMDTTVQYNLQPPGIPTSVTVTPKADTLDVRWTAASYATGYKVQWKAGAQSYAASRQGIVTGTRYKIPNLLAETTYTVRVIATKTGAPDGMPSAEQTGVPALLGSPAVVVAAKVDTLTVTWNVVNGATGYKVQWKSGAATYPTSDLALATHGQATIAGGSTTIHKISGLTAGTTYTIRVIATSTNINVADSAPSEEVMGTLATTRPTNVRVTPGPGQLIVAWTEATGATGYKVQWKSGQQAYNTSDRQATVSGGSTTTYTIENLTFGTTYTVRVTATLAGGADSTPSDEVMGTPQRINYDRDGDGLIDIKTLAQLHAIRWDLNGDGVVADNDTMNYNAAFPDRDTTSNVRMGCPSGTCTGYELLNNLDFDENGDGEITSADATYWNANAGWQPLGTYTGTLKGNNKTISNLYINRGGQNDVGLFRDITGTVSGLGLRNVDVRGNLAVGGLTGNQRGGAITGCYVTGRVRGSGSYGLGGLVGHSHTGANRRISASYSVAAVTALGSGGNFWVGGLVGWQNGGTIIASYATGAVTVTGSGTKGGLVGRLESSGEVTASYATGQVTGDGTKGGLVGSTSGTVTNSYWDSDQSGIAGGKSTSDLQSPSTYGATNSDTYYNWNLNVDSDTNTGDAVGRDDPWTFGAADQYPVLKYAGMDTAVQYNLQPPGIPTSVTVTPKADTLDVRWRAASNATGYKVQWKAGDQNYAASREETVTGTRYKIANLIAGTYTVRVIATKTGAPDSRPSAEQTGVPALLGSPTVMVAAKADTLTVTWNAVSNATGYKVQWKSGSATYPNADEESATHGQATIAGGGTTIHKISGLTAGMTYTIRVIATSTNVNIPDSDPSEEVMVTAATNKPTNVRVTPGSGQLIVRWTEATGATGYKVQWKSGGQSYNTSDRQTTVSGMSTTTYTIENLTFGTTYTVRVIATLAGGTDSTPSDEVTGTITDISYDSDGDGLIDIETLAQLHAIRWDLNGDGIVADTDTMNYNAAFPGRDITSNGRMGCPSGTCIGYELLNNLDFDTDGSGSVTSADTYPNWSPIGGTYSTTFKGNNKTISNLHINRGGQNDVGLFSRVSGNISGLGLKNVNVTGQRRVGGLVGNQVGGRILGCFVTGRVEGTHHEVGGLVGYSTGNNTVIAASYANAVVSGGHVRVAVGGLVGNLNATVIASYAIGPVSGFRRVGGLVGRLGVSPSPVSTSYATGTVTGQRHDSSHLGGLIGSAQSGVSHSYWDRESSGISSSSGGTSQTTSALRSETDYNGIYANWNVDVDGRPGNDAPWTFGAADQYPVLKYAGMDTTAQFAMQPPGIPTNVTVTPKADTLDVRWRAPSNATGYKVQWKSGAQNYDASREETVTGTRYKIANLLTGTTYTVRVIATKTGVRDGRPSAEQTGVPLLGSPTGVEVNAKVDTLTVTWNAVNGVTGYKVQWKSGSETYPAADEESATHGQATITDGGTTTYDISGLTAGTTYTIRVIATRTNVADSAPSEEVTGVPLLGSPTVMVAAKVDTLTVTWNAVSNATGYKVQWKSGAATYPTSDLALATHGQATIAGGSTTIHKISGLTTGTTYTIRVIATRTNVADSAPSDAVMVTLATTRPTNVRVTPGPAQLIVAWTEATGATGYKIQWKSGGQSYNTSDRQTTVSGMSTTTYTIENLTFGATYTVRVTATLAGGTDSTPSDEVMGTPYAINYDSDGDGLIDIKTLAQLHAIRWDLNGDGVVADNDTMNYNAAFPDRDTTSNVRMGCPSGTCTGYELLNNLDFDENGDGEITSADATYWNGSTGWQPIGTYTGTLKGNNKTISNLYINRGGQNDVGLFRDLTGTVSGLGLRNVDVRGNLAVGGLTGNQSGGAITGCYVTGRVRGSGSYGLGGLVGHSHTGANRRISASYSDADVTALGSGANFWVGGLVGWQNGGTIIASYATGAVTVTGNGTKGGLVGRLESSGEVTASYATGQVTGDGTKGGLVGSTAGTVTNSYWDSDRSGIAGGKSTSDLQSQTTYGATNSDTYYNWNLNVDSDTNTGDAVGNDDPWTFGAADQYPVLKYAGMDTTAQYNLQPPGRPTSVTVTVQMDTLDVRWRAASYATGYKVQWKSGAQNYDASREETVTGTRYKIPNLIGGTTYTVRVIATKTGAPDGRPSAEQTGVPLLGSPTGVEVNAKVDTLTVTWNAVNGATGYKVQWKSGAQTYPAADEESATHGQATITDGGTTTYKISGLTTGTTYAIRVIATRTNVADSAPSEEVITILMLGSPTGVEVSAKVDTLTVTWNAVPLATGYKVQWKSGSETYPNADVASATRGQATISGGSTTTYKISNVTAGTTYTIQVIATHTTTAGNSAPSEEVMVTSATTRPTNVRVTPGPGQLLVAWTEATGATGYKVQWKSGGQSYNTSDRQTTVSGMSTTTYTIENLTFGATYTVRVTATLAGGTDSDPSDEVTGTPYAINYDSDGDGLIDIKTLAQLHAIRWDLNGDGIVADNDTMNYNAAFPSRDITSNVRMGCPSGTCTGYELLNNLNFDENGDGEITSADATYWNANAGWQPIGTYTGTLKGNNKTISNLYINRGGQNDVGLFVDLTGTVSGLGLRNVDVRGNLGVGGLTGNQSGGAITGCYVTGRVRGSGSFGLGGLVGHSHTGANRRISASYSVAAVTALGSGGNFWVGGLVGWQNGGTIIASYATGAVTVTGSGTKGGLVGRLESSGEVTASYATGQVTGNGTKGGLVGSTSGTVTNSYWDSDRSGIAGGKSTSDLQSQTTYGATNSDTYYNWNLNVDSDTNTGDAVGKDDPWTFGAADQYPVLKYAGMDTTVQYNLQPPGIPTSVTVTPKADTLDVRWRAPSNATGYKVQWKSGDQNYDASREETVTGTRYKISNLLAETTYTVRVIATKTGVPDSWPSAEQTGVLALLGSPTVMVAAKVDTLTVTWNAVNGATGYKVQWKSGAATYPTSDLALATHGQATIAGGGTATYDISGLTAGTTYTIRVIATSTNINVADSTPSEEVMVTLATTRPTNVRVTPGPVQLIVAWTEATGATGYKIQWKSGGQSYNTSSRQETVSGGSTTTYTIENLTIGTPYTVRVTATLAGGTDSTPSDEVMGTPPGINYDSDGDGLIDIKTLAQLHAIRWDLNGDGVVADSDTMNYNAAFPNRDTTSNVRMGCPSGTCTGYELLNNLDFDENGDGEITSADATYWNANAGWQPLGTYTGTLKGNNKTISNLYINRGGQNDVGLFRDITGTVSGLGLRNVDVRGNLAVGGLTGNQRGGAITGCYVTGRVRGSGSFGLGGLVGHSHTGANRRISASYSVAAVTALGSGANFWVGGLVGWQNGGTIIASYATGAVTVTGSGTKGGLVGRLESSGEVTASYATGQVTGDGTKGGLVGSTSGTVTNSYWDSDRSGIAGGKTTRDLQSQTTYGATNSDTYYNWNLNVDSDTNTGDAVGKDDPWTFGAADQYPVLKYAGMDTTVQFQLQPAVVTLTLTPSSISESGGMSTVTATLTRSWSTATTITVRPVTGAYTVGMDSTITIAAGQTANASDTVVITAVDNTRDELNRDVTVSVVSDNTQGSVVRPIKITITDDDPQPRLSISSPSAVEGTALTFTVRLNAVSGKEVTVAYADAGTGTATSGTDYSTLTAGTLTFAAGTTSQTIAVSVSDDGDDEPNETVIVTLSSATNATISTAQGTGTIIDDDGMPALSIGSPSVIEGATSATLTFQVYLRPAHTAQVTVAYADAGTGTATSGTDYTALAAGTLTFAVGDTIQTIPVSVSDDGDDEQNETVIVELSSATNATISTAQGTGTIIDDESPSANLDVDGDGRVRLFSDIILVIRYVLFFRNEALLRGNVIEPTATRTTAQEIEPYLDTLVNQNILDVDGDGDVRLFSDIILIIRYVLFFRNEALVRGNVIEQNATRTTAQEIEPYIRSLYPDSHFQ